jgi:hypothetical protein
LGRGQTSLDTTLTNNIVAAVKILIIFDSLDVIKSIAINFIILWREIGQSGELIIINGIILD